MLAHIPKTKQRYAEPQSPFQIANLKQPIESRTEVVDLQFATGEPDISPLRGVSSGLPSSREHQTICGVRPSGRGFFSARGQTLARIFPNCLQHSEAGFIVWLFDALYQILIDERRKSFEQIDAEIETGIADCFGSIKRATADEDGKPPKQFLLRFIEEVVTPIDGVAQSLLALGKIERTSRQQLQPISEAIENGSWREDPGSCSCQFNGQRKPIHPCADVPNRSLVFRRNGKVRTHCCRALNEQLHG